MKRFLEVSDIRFNSDTGLVTFNQTRFDVSESGVKEVKSYGDVIIPEADGVTFKKFESLPSSEVVVEYAKGRVGESDIEVVYSETSTR